MRIHIFILLLLFLLCMGAATASPQSGDPQHVIIVMKERPAPDAGSAELASVAEVSQRDITASLKRMDASDVTQLWSVNAIATTLTEDQIRQVTARSDVARVVPDRTVTLDTLSLPEKGERGLRFYQSASEIESIGPSYPDSDDIAWGVSWIEAPEVWANGFDGSGVTVAIVDSGIFADHPDLIGKVVAWDDLVNKRPTAYDDNGHGTHCAGTVAGTGADGTITGVAPGANLIGIKVFDAKGNGLTSRVVKGFERAVELGADVISYSGGASWAEDFWLHDVVNSTAGVDQTFEVDNKNDGYDPSFVLVWVEAPRYSDVVLTLRTPSGAVYPGVDCDWYSEPLAPEYGMVKFIGDAPLSRGEWTLNVDVPLLNESNTVWFSGCGNDTRNILSKRFDLSDYIGVLDSATFEIDTWYDIEEDFDYGYVEVHNTMGDTWDVLLEFTGDGRGTYTADLTDYLPQQAGQNNEAYIDLRLRYETDDSVEWMGWYVDRMAIPEIGFYDDASGDAGWTHDPVDGWSRIAEEYPVYYEAITFYTDNGTSFSSQSVNSIVGNGTVFVTSAGNSGEYGLRTIGGPGAAEKAITVGATGDGEDYIAYYSSRGPSGWGENQRIKPDVVAPGSSIYSISRSGDYASMSGTSMACPHVSGLAALLLQANGTLTPDEVKAAIARTAVDLGPVGPDTDYGYGRVSAWAAVDNITPLEPPVYEAQTLYAGFGYSDLRIGEPNVITAISWNKTPVADEEIFFRVWNATSVLVNTTVMTNVSGMATASFVPGTGWYNYVVNDTCGNSVSGSICGYTQHSGETLLIDTPWKEYQALENATVSVKYTVVNPLTMEPYAGDVRMVVYSESGTSPNEYFNQILTPVNGAIQAEINGSLVTTGWADIELLPTANETQRLSAGYLTFYESGWCDRDIKEVNPFVSQAKRGGTATLLVKQYSALEGRPAPDGEYHLPVGWVYEADVRSLSEQFPVQTARFLAGEVEQFTPEYQDFFDEVQNLQESIQDVAFQSMNGIGTLTVEVPEGAYAGLILGESDYGPRSETDQNYEALAIIIVDMKPFMGHSTVPYAESERDLSIWGEWQGAYSSDVKCIEPGTEMDVTCYLQNADGAPMSGIVYLYTSDQSAQVITGSDGYGYATFPAQVRFPSSESASGLQVIGLSGDAYDYMDVYPPTEWGMVTGAYQSGIITGEAWIENDAGAAIPMPGIFEVNRQDISSGGFHHFSSSATTLSSEYITGDGEFIDSVPYGSYVLALFTKNYFQGPGEWTSQQSVIGATPLIVENPPPAYYQTGGAKTVNVRMSGGQAGVPVYITYDLFMPYSQTIYESVSGGVDLRLTDANGRATLTMNVPENSYLGWEIGGGTEDRVFTTLSGYSIQDTPPEIRGDLNGNGWVDIGDVSRVAWMVAGLTPVDMKADFNGDGEVDGGDAAKIAYYYVGGINVL